MAESTRTPPTSVLRTLDVACDYDDTLAAFTGLWVEAYNALFPEKPAITHLDINRYNLKSVGNLNEDELQETFRWIRAQNYNLKMYPVDKNFEYWFNRILRDGHRIFIITANPPEVIPKIKKWLKNFGIENIEVISVKNIDEKLTKAFDVIIDDSSELIEKMKNDDRKLITYAALHNKSFNHAARRLAMNWGEVYQHVCEIANERNT